MEQSPKKTFVEPSFGLETKTVKCKPHELIKINIEDLVDTFSRKMKHVGPLLHKSMCRAYKQALNDAHYLLLAAEKDTRSGAV